MRRTHLLSFYAVLLLLALLVFYTMPNPKSSPAVRAASVPLSISVSGNHFINGIGQTVRLIGVNLPAASDCLPDGNYPPGVFAVPSSTQAAQAIATWHVNAVRITMNEDCWLGINGVNPTFTGANYQSAIVSMVNLLNSYGIYVIIDLHQNAPGSYVSNSQQPMADADHAIAYWNSVAGVFKSDPAVLFEPYNEPHITFANAQTSNPWACWRDGCTITEMDQTGNQPVPSAPSWQAAGEQSLINAIRSTGATNPILITGLNWAQDLTQFFQYLPVDPDNQLAVTYHNYLGPNNTLAYWTSTIATIAAQMPVVTDELGENDCQTNFVSQYMTWADAYGISYLPWLWMNLGCNNYGLISNFNGTPSAYGQVFYNHFQAISLTS